MLGELAVLIVRTGFSIVLIALVARFLAQIARANFNNPLAHTVIKITSPFLNPVRRVIPSVAGLDIASLVVVFAGQLVLALLVIALLGVNPIPYISQLVIWAIVSVAGLILTVLQWSMIISAVGGLLTMGQYNPFLAFLQEIVEPFVGPLRKLNLQVGMLDLSYLVGFLIIIILRDFIIGGAILSSTGYYNFVLGLKGLHPFFGI
ncbi:YggT family protein [Reinekea sp.]|jgi:YggT family protein|uniref:YggT family protein n=2 Tax=Reinekea sp. TaxID=1970455 RepID=UPI0039896759